MNKKKMFPKKFAYLRLFYVFPLAVFVFSGCSQDNNTPIDDEDILISSQTDMAKIGVDPTYPLSRSYVLTDNITLADYTPIGTATTPFTGKFLGNGKTITLNSFSSTAVSNNMYLGIFAFVKGASASSKALIKNLTVNSSVNVTEGGPATNIGLVAGYAENVEVDNITLSGSFAYATTVTTTQLLGGLVGLSTGGTVIKNCNSSLAMNISPGGIGNNAQYSYIGGFVGQFKSGTGIENCHNTGDVISQGVGQTFVGGITGGSIYAMNTAYQGYIQDSSSTGTIIGQNEGYWTFAGGIAGTIVGGTVNDINATTRIVRCFAVGTVSCENTSASYPYVGGIVAYNYYGALVSQCYFDGEVIQKNRSTSGYTGGIAGYNSQAPAPNNSRIEDCWSGATIQGTNSTNNVVGTLAENANYSRCYAIQVLSNGTYRGTVTSGTNCFAVNPTAKPAQSEYADLGWDFTNIWRMGSDGYPILKWQNEQ